MKRFIKSLVVVAFVFGTFIPAWGQSTTEGKEFWVALTLSASPKSGTPTPFIAVSTKKPTKITITNPNDPSWKGVTRTAKANSWEVFESEIPLKQWYPTAASSIDKIKPEAGQTHNFGLKVETDEDVSVFAALWMANSFDAANILPVHVLQSEYYTQDYPPYIKPNDGDALSMFTILAAENNTRVTITPSSETQDGHAAGESYTVSLAAGQTYYVISKTLQSLSGTHVVSNNSKIAVFQGDVFTQIPGGKSARDCTYEQAMPIDFWGTKFVVTRSKEKDANRIRVTAANDNTALYIANQKVATIDAGKTWEFEMHKTQPVQKDLVHLPDAEYVADALYLQASCPVAVYSYDVSNGYVSTPTEMDNERGDPSMVWISPLEQRINNITFGVCGTSKTDKHYIDIVCQTDAKDQTTITPAPKDQLTWTAVPGKEEWSYARIHLSTVGKSGEGNRVFTLDNPMGCIAHVYGNGNDESYAYSVGSAAVKEGVLVGDIIFSEGEKDPKKYLCVDKTVEFNASVGLDEVTRADWNFGDGTTLRNAQTAVTHTYTSPGWYDVTVQRFGHQVCTDVDEQDLGAITFSVRVVKPYLKYIPTLICHEKSEPLPADGPDGNVDLDQCLDTIPVPYNVHRYNTDSVIDLGSVPDSIIVDGVTYRKSGEATRVLKNADGCEFRVTTKWEVIASLMLSIGTEGYTCDSNEVELPYVYTKGNIGDAWIVDLTTGRKIEVDRDYLPRIDIESGTFTLPTKDFRPGIYSLELHIKDALAEEYGWKIKEYTYPIKLTVQYSEYIFKRKYNNVLAVYKSERGANAGYTFQGYQWYYRDTLDNIAPIFGATSSVYHSEEPLHTGWYSVDLTNQAAVTIRSCEQFIDETLLPDLNPEEEEEEAEGAPQKVLRDQRVLILMENKLYNMYGQRVK